MMGWIGPRIGWIGMNKMCSRGVLVSVFFVSSLAYLIVLFTDMPPVAGGVGSGVVNAHHSMQVE